MAVAFREVFSAFGVDADGDKPRMMVPLHGTNLVALEGDPDLVLVPGRDSLKVEKLEKGKLAHTLAAAQHLATSGREIRQLGKDATYFQVYGVNRAGGFDGVPLNAVNPNTPKKVEKTIAVNVLGENPIKIAIRAVQIKGDDGKWVSHGKVAFDPQALCDQMNTVWVPQANVKFSLVATDPLKIDEKELADELKRTGVSKAAFLNQVHIQAFDPLFRRHKVEKADFTIFLVKSILDRDLNAHKGGQEPAGATPPKSGFCLVCDQMASDPVREAKKQTTIPGTVPAHEAGHFLGLDNHPSGAQGEMLMREGGPTVGVGRVTVDQTLRFFNGKY
jgi:hypothetical protein